MDLWSWLSLVVAPLALAVLIFKAYRLKPNPETLNRIMAQEMAKIANEIGLRYTSPDLGERRKDIMRKQYLNLKKAGLTPEDLEWVADQMKLTGFDPTRQRYATDAHHTYLPSGYFYPGGRW